jgi:hypothetical protein
VLRALLVSAVLCISFEMSGLSAVLPDMPCSEDCPTDRSGGECAPGCQLCGCCALPKTLGVPAPGTPALRRAVGTLVWTGTADRPPSGEPRDIWHIPKPTLA